MVEADPAEATRRLQLLQQLVADAPPELLDDGFLRACLRAKKQDPAKAAALVNAPPSPLFGIVPCMFCRLP